MWKRDSVWAIAIAFMAFGGRSIGQEPVAAGLDDIVKVIDLRSFPKPPGAVPQRSTIAASVPCLGLVRYDVPATVKDAVDFYTENLLAAGWTEAPKTDKLIPARHVSEDGANLTFAKQGFILFFMIYKSQKPDVVSVHIRNHGNVDTRSLPRIDGGKLEQQQPQMTRYSTERKVADVAGFTRKALVDAGWQEINRRPGHSRVDVELLEFRKNAIKLSVHVSVPPDLAGRTAVNYSVEVLNDELPAMPNSTDIELEDSDHDIQPPLELKFATAASMQQVAEFYKQVLTARGWKFREGAGLLQQTKGFLYYDGAGGEEMRLDMKRPPNEPTEVKLVRVSADMLKREKLAEAKLKERMKQQRIREEAQRKKRDMKEAERKRMVAEKEKASVNARPRDIPIPVDATKIVADTFFNRLTFECPSTRALLIEFYRKELGERGWVEQGKSSPLVTGYMRFKKEKQSLTVNIDNRRGRPTSVRLDTREVEWIYPKSSGEP